MKGKRCKLAYLRKAECSAWTLEFETLPKRLQAGVVGECSSNGSSVQEERGESKMGGEISPPIYRGLFNTSAQYI
jgi:hypothetical protein